MFHAVFAGFSCFGVRLGLRRSDVGPVFCSVGMRLADTLHPVCHQLWMKAEQKAFQVASDLLQCGGLFQGKVDGNSDTLCWDGNEPNPWGSFGGGSR